MREHKFSEKIRYWINNKEVKNKDDVKDYAKEITLKELKKEINKELQVANRRLQNIEKSNITSPAYKALINEIPTGRQNRFQKLSIAGLDLNNKSELIKAIDIYSRALSFINNSTSSLVGAKHFIQKIADDNNISFKFANHMLDTITSPEMTNGKIQASFNYNLIKDAVSEYENEYKSNIESQEDYERRIEQRVKELMTQANNLADDIIDIFDL